MAQRGLPSYSSFLHENSKELVVLLLLGAVAGAAFYFFTFKQPNNITSFEEKGVLDLEQITVNEFQLERKSWKLKGIRAVISEKSFRMRIEQVKIWVFAPDNTSAEFKTEELGSTMVPTPRVNLYITADQGLLERNDNRVTLSGNVILLRNDGSEVHTETAIYDAKKDVLTIPKPVRVLRDGYTMLGSGLTYLVSEGKLNLNNPVLMRHEGETKNED
ncbi:MAG: LPS export ABC transporter periplasmic protein LptC [SAR324 cluster bacterium]|nr:LPS export ABC transporter periplasmic protein LptC [SAR324 cluster bacterium]MBL7035030.1 LPS export ABC transporter periplasmic protein LptC [SAR324 cluster bacterium]